MDAYQNKEYKLVPFTGNALDCFVLSKKMLKTTVTLLKPAQGNEDVLLTSMQNRWRKQQEAVTKDIKKYHPN